eukprot:s2533_g9.t1
MMAAVHGNRVQGIPVGQVGPSPGIVGASQYAAPMPIFTLPPEELIVLNYRTAVMCFAFINLLVTVLNVVTAVVWDTRWGHWSLILLVFTLGPVSGLIGAKHLNRALVTVYLGFCIFECIVQIALAVWTFWLWTILFAFVQVWVTKIVATFWYCLGKIPLDRRSQLLDLKDVEVEASKTRLQDHLGGDPKSPEAATAQKVLLYLLEVSLKLLHPFMPFVTEAVWQRLPRTKSSPWSLMISAWPQPATKRDKEAEGWFTKLCAVTSAVRNARAEQGIAPKERLPLTFWCSDAGFQEALQSERSALSWLARADPDQIEARPMAERPAETPEGCIRIVASEEIEVDMPVPKKEIDVEKDPTAEWGLVPWFPCRSTKGFRV